jgi:hypothetical protein
VLVANSFPPISLSSISVYRMVSSASRALFMCPALPDAELANRIRTRQKQVTLEGERKKEKSLRREAAQKPGQGAFTAKLNGYICTRGRATQVDSGGWTGEASRLQALSRTGPRRHLQTDWVTGKNKERRRAKREQDGSHTANVKEAVLRFVLFVELGHEGRRRREFVVAKQKQGLGLSQRNSLADHTTGGR